MTDFTIITTDNVIRADISHTAFTEDGDCLLIGDDAGGQDGEQVGHVPERRFIAAVETHCLLDPSPSPA